MSATLEKEIVEKVRNLCRDFLGGQWSTATEDEISISVLSSGFANRNYKCTLVSTSDVIENVPNVVVVRLFGVREGVKARSKFIGDASEAVVLQRLSLNGFVPKLYAVFDGGFIQEYVDSNNLTFGMLSKEPKLYDEVAEKCAKIHSCEMPVSKVPNRVDLFLNRLLSYGKLNVNALSPDLKELSDLILSFNVEEELRWFIKYAPAFGGKPVFSHNDFHQNNVLVRKIPNSNGEKVVIIDFETSGYYYRGLDLGYFLEMRKSEFTQKDGKYTRIDHIDQDEEGTKRRFVNAYLHALSQEGKSLDPLRDTVDQILIEIEYFAPLLHLITVGLCEQWLHDAKQFVDVKDSGQLWLDWCKIVIHRYKSHKRELLQKYSKIFEKEE